MSAGRGRRRPCTVVEARALLANARAYLETATLVRTEPRAGFDHVAVGTAVLAAIAASDAICCRALGERARGQDHHEAVELLSQVRFGAGGLDAQARRATELARALETALDLKGESHYGVHLLGEPQLQRVVRAAQKLIDAADEILG